METYYGSMYYFAPGGTAVPAMNPGNASVPGRPCEHASAAEYLQRDIANSNSNLHSNNIHCIIHYYSSIQLIQLWFLTWCVLVAGLLQSAVCQLHCCLVNQQFEDVVCICPVIRWYSYNNK